MTTSLLGCASSVPSLTLHPANTDRPFTAEFTRAFWSPDQAGEDQVVLLNDPVDRASADSAGDPLHPLSVVPIRQLLVIHLQWPSPISTHTDTPASSNAVLDWYVYGGGTASIVHYTGSAYVSVDAGKSEASVDIRHGSLTRVEKLGPLQDPFGSFTIDGTVKAVRSSPQLRQVLGDLSTAMTEARQADAAASADPKPE